MFENGKRKSSLSSESITLRCSWLDIFFPSKKKEKKKRKKLLPSIEQQTKGLLSLGDSNGGGGGGGALHNISLTLGHFFGYKKSSFWPWWKAGILGMTPKQDFFPKKLFKGIFWRMLYVGQGNGDRSEFSEFSSHSLLFFFFRKMLLRHKAAEKYNLEASQIRRIFLPISFLFCCWNAGEESNCTSAAG